VEDFVQKKAFSLLHKSIVDFVDNFLNYSFFYQHGIFQTESAKLPYFHISTRTNTTYTVF